MFVVTESLRYKHIEDQYLNVPDGSVRGIYYTKEEAERKITEILCSPFYRIYHDYVKQKKDGFDIIVPNYLAAQFRIYDYNTRV